MARLVGEVKLKIKGINKVMKDPAVQGLLRGKAERVAIEANRQSGLDTYVAHTPKEHRWIARARVGTTEHDSIRDNSKNNTLMKSLDAGRD